MLVGNLRRRCLCFTCYIYKWDFWKKKKMITQCVHHQARGGLLTLNDCCYSYRFRFAACVSKQKGAWFGAGLLKIIAVVLFALWHFILCWRGRRHRRQTKFAKKKSSHICELKSLFLPECCQLQNNKAKVVWLHQINFLLMGTKKKIKIKIK